MYDDDSVHGLNLAVPEQAKALIKPWSEREDMTQFADSGVDDQVRTNHERTQSSNATLSTDDRTRSLFPERADQVRHTQNR